MATQSASLGLPFPLSLSVLPCWASSSGSGHSAIPASSARPARPSPHLRQGVVRLNDIARSPSRTRLIYRKCLGSIYGKQVSKAFPTTFKFRRQDDSKGAQRGIGSTAYHTLLGKTPERAKCPESQE